MNNLNKFFNKLFVLNRVVTNSDLLLLTPKQNKLVEIYKDNLYVSQKHIASLVGLSQNRISVVLKDITKRLYYLGEKRDRALLYRVCNECSDKFITDSGASFRCPTCQDKANRLSIERTRNKSKLTTKISKEKTNCIELTTIKPKRKKIAIKDMNISNTDMANLKQMIRILKLDAEIKEMEVSRFINDEYSVFKRKCIVIPYSTMYKILKHKAKMYNKTKHLAIKQSYNKWLKIYKELNK